MYRIQQSCEIKYGHFATYLSACEELNALCAARGWRTSQIFTPLGGTNNRIVLETDYPTLNEFERENNAFYADPEAMKILGSTAEMVVQGSSRTQILAPAPHLA